MLYIPHGTKGLGTISDAKSHMAPATWVSLNELKQFIDLEETETLYIASDSPSSQYRNKNNILLTKDWAIKNKIEVYWVFTECGHGKEPMEGIRGKIKKQIKDTIGYNPNQVISNKNELLKHLPVMENIMIGTYTEENVKEFSALVPH